MSIRIPQQPEPRVESLKLIRLLVDADETLTALSSDYLVKERVGAQGRETGYLVVDDNYLAVLTSAEIQRTIDELDGMRDIPVMPSSYADGIRLELIARSAIFADALRHAFQELRPLALATPPSVPAPKSARSAVSLHEHDGFEAGAL